MSIYTTRHAAALLVSVSISALVPTLTWAQSATDPQDAGARSRHSEATVVDEVVVTGRSLDTGVSTVLPVEVLAGEELVHRRQGGLGETLAGLPGVHLDNFGGGASRPVIRGQTVPRIEVLTDGATLFDASSVSPDHAITTDPLLLDAIEIQRGPAAVRYGGSAVNGAINLIDGKTPRAIPDGGMSGAIEARYGTGDEERTIVGRMTAGVGPIALHAEGSVRQAEDYAVPEGYGSDELRDSFADSSSYALGASWITSKGYLGAAYSRTESEYGLPGHSHINGVCHTHGTDLHCAAHGEFEDPFGSPDSHTAYIKLRSDRTDVRGDFDDLLPGLDHLRLRLSYTDYEHDEIDGPALFTRYTNEVYDGRLELTHAPLFGFTGTFGVQYTDGTFSGLNVNDLHQQDTVESEGFFFGFVPPYDYVTENAAVFLSERRSIGPVDLEFAVRKDWREITQPLPKYVQVIGPGYAEILETIWGPDWQSLLDSFKELIIADYLDSNPPTKQEPFSASVGATWRLDRQYSASLSLAQTERAPSVRELFAYGNNLATNSYEVGLAHTRRASSQFPASRTDVLERTRSIDLTVRKVGGPLEFEVGLFHQDVDDYIYARLIETDAETGTPHNYLVYTAAQASFTGIDGEVSYRFSPERRLTVFGDYVDAELKSADDNLPRIPPGRLGARYDATEGSLSWDVEYYRTFEQDRVAAYETPTGGYDMVNATVAYSLDLVGLKNVEVYARGSNLTDELAFAHTSFVKNQSPLRGRNIAIGIRYEF